MRIRRNGWVHRMLHRLSEQAREADKSLGMLEVAIASAYLGAALVTKDEKIHRYKAVQAIW